MAYLVKRFDYAQDGSKLDQEDFASIIGMSEETDGANYKYDSSYEAIALRAKEVMAASSSAIEDFYHRVIFNYLIGNGDAHLKNFSLYRQQGRRDLDFTPNYDLLYTKYHINEEFGEMGLELFTDYETKSYGALGFYSLEDCEVFSTRIGIPQKRLVKIYQNIFASVEIAEKMIMESFMSEKGKIAYLTNFTDRIQKRLRYTAPQSGFEFDSVIKPLAQEYLKTIT
jgi:serine/threonine-protein kinase HipA